MHFHNILFKIDNFIFIVLTIIVPVFNLGMTFRKVKHREHPEKVWKRSLKV